MPFPNVKYIPILHKCVYCVVLHSVVGLGEMEMGAGLDGHEWH